ILTIEVDQAIGIVIPTALRREMELRSQRLAIEVLRAGYLVGLLDSLEPRRLRRNSFGLQDNRAALPRTDIYERPPIRFPFRQFDVEKALQSSLNPQFQMACRRAILYWQIKIMFLYDKLSRRVCSRGGLSLRWQHREQY